MRALPLAFLFVFPSTLYADDSLENALSNVRSARLLGSGDRNTVLLNEWLSTGVWTFGTITVDSRTWLPKSYELFSAPIQHSGKLDEWVEIDGIHFPGRSRLEPQTAIDLNRASPPVNQTWIVTLSNVARVKLWELLVGG